MIMEFEYRNHGTCSQAVQFEIEDNKLKNVCFIGGCNGNLQGIARLVKGRPAAQVAEELAGINCNGRGTSCPDQISKALKEMLV